MDITKFSTEIAKTGFVLEFKVSNALRERGWTVINNKYYVDDFQEAVREVDLVAYKVASTPDFKVFTTLIVSCKKNASDAWVLLAKDLDPHDPNIDWYPLHIWSNDKALNFQLSVPRFQQSYVSFLTRYKCGRISSLPERHIFAFQEMNLQTGKPNNDKNIFGAITGLMKAQAYELHALPQRKSEPSLYQFNLVNVVDTDLVRLDFDKDSIVPREVVAETYVANYIVSKRQTSARINFVRWESLGPFLDACDNLHEANNVYFLLQHDSFFQDIVLDNNRRRILLPAFREKVYAPIWHKLREVEPSDFKKDDIDLWWSKDKKLLNIDLSLSDEQANMLNLDESVTKAVKDALAEIYRYHGPFEVCAYDLPF